MIQGKLPLVPVLLAFMLLGCSSTSVRHQPVSRHRPKPTHTASPTPRVNSESETRKSLLKRSAGLTEEQAAAVLAGAGIPVENGISAKFTLAKTINKGDSATLKNIAPHLP